MGKTVPLCAQPYRVRIPAMPRDKIEGTSDLEGAFREKLSKLGCASLFEVDSVTIGTFLEATEAETQYLEAIIICSTGEAWLMSDSLVPYFLSCLDAWGKVEQVDSFKCIYRLFNGIIFAVSTGDIVKKPMDEYTKDYVERRIRKGQKMITLLIDYERLARAWAGNWKTFPCFIWTGSDLHEDPEDWCIYYFDTHTLLGQSNRDYMMDALEKFTVEHIKRYKTSVWGTQEAMATADVSPQNHRSAIVGTMAGIAVRVYRKGKITRAFKRFIELVQRLENYPVLDEDAYADVQYEATYKNIRDEIAIRLITDDVDSLEYKKKVIECIALFETWLDEDEDRKNLMIQFDECECPSNELMDMFKTDHPEIPWYEEK